MLGKTNIEERLVYLRNKRISPDDLLAEVQHIFQTNETEREDIKHRLAGSSGGDNTSFDLDLLASERIFHREDIKKLCVDYRLRFWTPIFLKENFPKKPFPISEI